MADFLFPQFLEQFVEYQLPQLLGLLPVYVPASDVNIKVQTVMVH